MTSEKELRQIAQAEVREAAARYTALWENHPHLLEGEWERVADMISEWPIPDLPPADRDGYWWPRHGRNYGNVHASDGHVWVARGGPGEASRYSSLYLTLDEAEELASMLMAAAHHERNQE